ncbi:iron transporter [Pseudomonas schmalbachii]|uniref:Iron transporter n=1 Tax=Pseudomonas schmalbachii TaxID=2816993 RepID=A0ABS3TLN0_9PSED|nr:iron transporter [Pseudomonas schmalbachii]MBO3274298.1 iron transporter [Pseudomonas schmalbachii]
MATRSGTCDGRWRHAGAVALRVLAAVPGGYLVSYALTAGLAALLPLERPDAALVATLPSFAIYLGILLWTFATPRPGRLWLGLLLLAALAVAVAGWPGEGRP